MINNSKILKIAIVCTLVIILVFAGVIWYKRYYQTKVPGLVDTQQSKIGSQYPVPNSGGAFAVLYPFTPTSDFVSAAQASMTIQGYVSSIQPATGALAKDYMIVKLRTTGGQAIVNDFYVKNNTPIVRQNKDKPNKGSVQDLPNNTLVNVTILKNVKQNSQWTVSQITITQ
jgi:hypothetical protein